MQLLTPEVIDLLPRLYSQERTKDPICTVKFFHPCSSWTWYAYEGSPINQDGEQCAKGEAQADFLFFGWVHGSDPELGYFVLSELESVKGPLGLGIERDLHWEPKPLSVIRAASCAGRTL